MDPNPGQQFLNCTKSLSSRLNGELGKLKLNPKTICNSNWTVKMLKTKNDSNYHNKDRLLVLSEKQKKPNFVIFDLWLKMYFIAK